MDSSPFYKSYLQEELKRRRHKNSKYSMRAFAKAIQLDPGLLSRVLSDKRILSIQAAKQVSQYLNLTPEKQKLFLSSVFMEHNESFSSRLMLQLSLPSAEETTYEISHAYFDTIKDWYHYAIRQLTLVEGFKSDPKWIARALGITVMEATLAIRRMLRLGLLETDGKTLKKSSGAITTMNKELTSDALKIHQKQILEMALESLAQDPIEKRNMSGMTMAIDPAKVPMARKMIQRFMEELNVYLEGDHKKSVYQLTVSLYPLRRNKKSMEKEMSFDKGSNHAQ